MSGSTGLSIEVTATVTSSTFHHGHAVGRAADFAVDGELLGIGRQGVRIIDPREISGRVPHAGQDQLVAVEHIAKFDHTQSQHEQERGHNGELDKRGTCAVGRRELEDAA